MEARMLILVILVVPGALSCCPYMNTKKWKDSENLWRDKQHANQECQNFTKGRTYTMQGFHSFEWYFTLKCLEECSNAWPFPWIVGVLEICGDLDTTRFHAFCASACRTKSYNMHHILDGYNASCLVAENLTSSTLTSLSSQLPSSADPSTNISTSSGMPPNGTSETTSTSDNSTNTGTIPGNSAASSSGISNSADSSFSTGSSTAQGTPGSPVTQTTNVSSIPVTVNSSELSTGLPSTGNGNALTVVESSMSSALAIPSGSVAVTTQRPAGGRSVRSVPISAPTAGITTLISDGASPVNSGTTVGIIASVANRQTTGRSQATTRLGNSLLQSSVTTARQSSATVSTQAAVTPTSVAVIKTVSTGASQSVNPSSATSTQNTGSNTGISSVSVTARTQVSSGVPFIVTTNSRNSQEVTATVVSGASTASAISSVTLGSTSPTFKSAASGPVTPLSTNTATGVTSEVTTFTTGVNSTIETSAVTTAPQR